ncbi:hypothetical protein SGPA1_50783 [Streptomyces misionensis JCM 4497]
MPNARTAALLNRGRERSRARGSSSGSSWATPRCQRPPTRTRTRGSAWMFRTYCDAYPYSETSQNEPPTRRPPTGVRRGFPETRPVVSSSVWNGSRRLTGLATYRWKRVTRRCLRPVVTGIRVLLLSPALAPGDAGVPAPVRGLRRPGGGPTDVRPPRVSLPRDQVLRNGGAGMGASSDGCTVRSGVGPEAARLVGAWPAGAAGTAAGPEAESWAARRLAAVAGIIALRRAARRPRPGRSDS